MLLNLPTKLYDVDAVIDSDESDPGVSARSRYVAITKIYFNKEEICLED